MTDSHPLFRIGHGFDIHRLEPPPPEGRGRPLIIGGVRFDHEYGVVSHSDGDALYHAVTDALLGAIAEPDIGRLFPDTDPKYEALDSIVFLEEAVHRVELAGYRAMNLDTTVILQSPKLGDARETIRKNLAGALGVPLGCVNVKATTHEKVDAIGEGRAIAAHAVVILQRVSIAPDPGSRIP